MPGFLELSRGLGSLGWDGVRPTRARALKHEVSVQVTERLARRAGGCCGGGRGPGQVPAEGPKTLVSATFLIQAVWGSLGDGGFALGPGTEVGEGMEGWRPGGEKPSATQPHNSWPSAHAQTWWRTLWMGRRLGAPREALSAGPELLTHYATKMAMFPGASSRSQPPQF